MVLGVFPHPPNIGRKTEPWDLLSEKYMRSLACFFLFMHWEVTWKCGWGMAFQDVNKYQTRKTKLLVWEECCSLPLGFNSGRWEGREGKKGAGRKPLQRACCNAFLLSTPTHWWLSSLELCFYLCSLYTLFQHFSAYRWVMRHEEGEILSLGPHMTLVSRRVSLALG